MAALVAIALATGALWLIALAGGAWLLRLIHLAYLARAASRGPGPLAGYEVRRGVRRLVWRLTRRW